MKTIETLKSQINVSEIRKEGENSTFNIYEDATDAQVVDMVLFSTICREMKNNAISDTNSRISNSRASIEYSTTYTIENESMIDFLRNLWKNSKNNFVKSVIETVGKTRKFTDKQLDILVDEIIKLNFSLNF